MKIDDKVFWQSQQGLEMICTGKGAEGWFEFTVTEIHHPEAEGAPIRLTTDGKVQRGWMRKDIGTSSFWKASDMEQYLYEKSPGHWVEKC